MLGLDLSQVGADLGAMVGGNYVQSFRYLWPQAIRLSRRSSAPVALTPSSCKTFMSPDRMANWFH